MGLSQYDEAIKSFEQVIKLAPEKANGYYGRGAAYATKGEFAKAKVDLDKAIGIEPDAEKYEACAMVNYELKDKIAAYADVQNAMDVDPNPVLTCSEAYYSCLI